MKVLWLAPCGQSFCTWGLAKAWAIFGLQTFGEGTVWGVFFITDVKFQWVHGDCSSQCVSSICMHMRHDQSWLIYHSWIFIPPWIILGIWWFWWWPPQGFTSSWSDDHGPIPCTLITTADARAGPPCCTCCSTICRTSPARMKKGL